MKGKPQVDQGDDALTISFTRDIPGMARQQIGYCALSNGAVVFSRWEALKDIEVTELVDHPFRWVEIDKFISRPSAKQTSPGIWTIDGKLQMQIIHGGSGELAKDGINGSVRRNFSARAGDVLQDSVCIYQSEIPGRKLVPVTDSSKRIVLSAHTVERAKDGHLSIMKSGFR